MSHMNILKSALMFVTIGVFFLLFSPASFAQSAARTDGNIINEVVADIDGEPLTVKDLEQYAALQGQDLPPDIFGGDTKIMQLVKDMVLSKLIEREAKESGIEVSSEEIASYIEEIRRQNGVDVDGFRKLLESRGLSEQDYKRVVAGDILRAKVISAKVRAKVQIVDEDVKRYIEKNPQRIPPAGMVRVEQIFFPIDISANEKALAETLSELRKRIIGGLEFSQAGGANYSDLGYMNLADLSTELRQAAVGLEDGGVSNVIIAGQGVYLLRVSGSTRGENGVAPGMEKQIRDELYQAALKEGLEKFLTEQLPTKYEVEIKL